MSHKLLNMLKVSGGSFCCLNGVTLVLVRVYFKMGVFVFYCWVLVVVGGGYFYILVLV
jgi:hypothetical protein